MQYLRSWIEVDTKKIAGNIRLLKSKLKSGTGLLVVVKGDAYGHGMVECSRVAIREGADLLGVAYLEEAIKLRENKIKIPLVLLTQPSIEEINSLIENNVSPAVYSYDFAKKLSSRAVSQKKKVRIHIKLDTGFNRLGLKRSYAVSEIRKINDLPNIVIEGLFTHFASATKKDLAFTKKQFDEFFDIASYLDELEIKPKYLHTANSPAFVWFPKSHLNLVRLGMTVFGLQPSTDKIFPLPIKCGLTWKTRVLQVKKIKKDETVGYDNTWKAEEDTTIACIAVGYADGFRRGPKNFGFVLCRGIKFPIIGKISMSLATIQIDKPIDIKVGDEVVLLGKQGKQSITPEDLERATGTSNEEIVTNISKTLPRVFL